MGVKGAVAGDFSLQREQQRRPWAPGEISPPHRGVRPVGPDDEPGAHGLGPFARAEHHPVSGRPCETRRLSDFHPLLGKTEQPGVEAGPVDVDVVAAVGLLAAAVQVVDVDQSRLGGKAHVGRDLQTKVGQRHSSVSGKKTTAASFGAGTRSLHQQPPYARRQTERGGTPGRSGPDDDDIVRVDGRSLYSTNPSTT